MAVAWVSLVRADHPLSKLSDECSEDPKAVALYTGPGYTVFFPSAYVPREGAISDSPSKIQHRLYGLPCSLPRELAQQILAHDIREQAYAELGLVKLEVLPRTGPTPELWAYRKVLSEGFQKMGDTFTLTDLTLRHPAFEIDITAPYPLTLLVMESGRSVYYITAGRPGEYLREIVESIEEFTPESGDSH